MYYEQLFQTNEAKMNFVKGLIRISKADGGISPEEQTFFIDARPWYFGRRYCNASRCDESKRKNFAGVCFTG